MSVTISEHELTSVRAEREV